MQTIRFEPGEEPMTLDEAKAHLRVDGTDEDELIRSYLTAARGAVEAVTFRVLTDRAVWVLLDRFPCGREQRLLPPPVKSITAVIYLDEAGTERTWEAEQYRLVPATTSGRLTLSLGAYWPATAPLAGAVTVKCICGYGAAADVPEVFKQAIRQLIAHYYATREAGGMTPDVAALLAPHIAHCFV